MFERKILAAFLHDRKDYDTAINHIDRSELSPMAEAVLEEITEYYDTDSEARKVDLEVFKRQLETRFGTIPRHLEKANDFMEGVVSTDMSAANVVATILDQKRARLGARLADALLAQACDEAAHLLFALKSLKILAQSLADVGAHQGLVTGKP